MAKERWFWNIVNLILLFNKLLAFFVKEILNIFLKNIQKFPQDTCSNPRIISG
jgi:hypothetical protein